MQRLTKQADLRRMATTVRRDIIKMLVAAGSGHSAGPLGLVDIAVALYFNVLENIDPKEPNQKDRDRVYVSCGHTNPVWYATLARAGYFPVEELTTLRKLGTRLQGHMDHKTVPGVDSSAASLGQGLGIACGSALAARMNGDHYHSYGILSDGEHDEGSTWEAVMFAGHYRLENLTAIIDRNNIQIDGNTEDVMTKEPLRERYEAFGWHVIMIDGHNIEHVIDACREAKAIAEKPVCLIAHTIPGKGVDFMEGDFRWHGNPPDKQQGKEALKQLRTLAGKIDSCDVC